MSLGPLGKHSADKFPTRAFKFFCSTLYPAAREDPVPFFFRTRINFVDSSRPTLIALPRRLDAPRASSRERLGALIIPRPGFRRFSAEFPLALCCLFLLLSAAPVVSSAVL